MSSRCSTYRGDSVTTRRRTPGRTRWSTSYWSIGSATRQGQPAAARSRSKLADARPDHSNGEPWRWDSWATSGSDRYQGGSLAGVTSKLDYLQGLGVTTVWLSPVFRQRGHLDTYHGYGVQDFLDVDPRFGTRNDLVELVSQAHQRGLRVLLDVIFNHSGANWLYPPGISGGELKPAYTSGQYAFGEWRGDEGQSIPGHRGPRRRGMASRVPRPGSLHPGWHRQSRRKQVSRR